MNNSTRTLATPAFHSTYNYQDTTIHHKIVNYQESFVRPFDSRTDKIFLDLYKQVSFSLSHLTRSVVVQFLGPQRRVGVSSIVREFAYIVSSQIGKSVLLIECELENGKNKSYYSGNASINHSNPDNYLEKSVTKVSGANFYLSKFSIDLNVHNCNGFYSYMDTVLDTARKKFDLILIDSQSTVTANYNLRLCQKADGVLLVVQADKTDIKTTELIANKVRENGGNMIGLVYNRVIGSH